MNDKLNNDIFQFAIEFERANLNLKKGFASNIDPWSKKQERRFISALRLSSMIIHEYVKFTTSQSELDELKKLAAVWIDLIIDTDTQITVLDHIGHDFKTRLNLSQS